MRSVLPPSLIACWIIGRTEIRCRTRSVRENGLQLLALVVGIGIGALFALVGVAGLFFLGTGIHAGDIENPLSAFETIYVYLWLFVTGMTGYRVYANGLEPEGTDGLLTTVSHRDLIGGLVVAELLLWMGPAVVLGGLGALAFAAGVQSPSTAPLLFVSIVSVVTLGVLSGFCLALAIKNAGVRSRLLARLRTVFLIVLGAAYFVVLVTQSFASVIDPLVAAGGRTPLAWFVDLSLLAVSSDASLVRGIGAIAIGIGGVVVASKLLGVLAGWLWYTDFVHLERGAETPLSDGPSLSPLSDWLPRSIYGVVRVDWSRARRAPITLAFALYPVIVLAMPITTAVQTRSINSSLPILVALCGAWITGTLFALNVLGNEGAALPVTAIGVNSGRSIVVGHVVAGALVGVPTTAITTAVLALASPLTPAAAGTLTLSAITLSFCAGPLASGIGTLFPRYEAVSVSRSREAIVPSTIAFAVYSIALLLVAAPALLSHSLLVRGFVHEWIGVSPFVLGLFGTGVTVAVGAVLGMLSLYRAFRAVSTFQFD